MVYGDIIENLMLGLTVALSLENIFFCFIGVFLGTFIGVVPGIGAVAAISLLFPITFHMEPVSALVMLAGIYYGTAYGGSTASILLNLPGTPSSAVACLDGYPMSQQGRGGIALVMTAVASFIGASIGILLMIIFSPVVVAFAMSFGAAEYFSIMVLGVMGAAAMSSGSAVKAIAMVVLGILFGAVGMDVYTGAPRFTFGFSELLDGVSLTAIAMGLFGVAEVIASFREGDRGNSGRMTITTKSMRPERDDIGRSVMPIFRGTAIGSFFGALPGTGGSVASYMAYALEKQVAKDPSRFGKGAIEGLVAPEAANNAADQTAFIPTMTLGVPGSPTMAIILGVLIIHGITPGPSLMIEKPDVFWGLIMSFWIGNIMLVILNIPLIGVWVRVLSIPYHILYPSILVFVCVGIYSLSISSFEVLLVLFFGAVGYISRMFAMPIAPMLLGFVLGPLMEENFRRAMLYSRGDIATFIERPVSAAFIGLTVCFLLYSYYRSRKMRLQTNNEVEAFEP